LNLIWLKRDFRTRDHEPIYRAIETGQENLIVWIVEPSLVDHPEMSLRHWQFMWASFKEFQKRIQDRGGRAFVAYGEVKNVLETIQNTSPFERLYSHQETGLKLTFNRDRDVAEFCKKNKIEWLEYRQQGVTRGRKNRNNWDSEWRELMSSPRKNPDWKKARWSKVPDSILTSLPKSIQLEWSHYPAAYQAPGEKAAHERLGSFLRERSLNYRSQIGKPGLAIESCSRLSTHLAWGTISVRQVYQAARTAWEKGNKRNLSAFISRIHWHCHFIQKFESECRMEFEDLNRGFTSLEKPYRADWVEAWQKGETGVPMVDACMRSLNTTGYLNFRMRAMLVSFLTHHLWQPWQKGAPHLANVFLDFEPGIHFPQIQMQAGTTGINLVRLYNPVKQGLDQDPEGVFIRKWIPELERVPNEFIHEPWNMTLLERELYGFKLGEQYPSPIVNVEESARRARKKIWEAQKWTSVRKERFRILAMHTTTERRISQRTKRILE